MLNRKSISSETMANHLTERIIMQTLRGINLNSMKGYALPLMSLHLNNDLIFFCMLFIHQVAPYLTLFFNGVGWQPEFPRLMTKNQLTAATYKALSFPGFRFRNIADISCDIKVRP